MAKFNEDHPGHEVHPFGNLILSEGDEMFWDSREGTCNCLTKTHWYSISFQAPYCSDECLQKEWDGYIEACGGYEARYTPPETS